MGTDSRKLKRLVITLTVGRISGGNRTFFNNPPLLTSTEEASRTAASKKLQGRMPQAKKSR